MALSMAILTQLRISLERYRLAMEDFKLADTAAQVDKRLANYTRASVTARLDSELEAVRTEARAILRAYQRAILTQIPKLPLVVCITPWGLILCLIILKVTICSP